MPNWTKADLDRQFDRAVKDGLIPVFANAAKSANFPLPFLLAIASRETNIRNIKGDFRDGVYHGYGIMQVDIGTDPGFCKSWTPACIEGSIFSGVAILAQKRIALMAKRIIDLKSIAAAYNTGAADVIRSTEAGIDCDSTTTDHDYGSDVIARMMVFAARFEARKQFSPVAVAS